MADRNAFSMIELILVLAIIAVLAATAAPRYANALANYRAEVAARRIVADLDLARAEARSAGASRTVTFDVSDSTLSITQLADMDNTAATYVVDLAAEPYGARIVWAEFGGDAAVVFDGYGQADTGGKVVVRVGGRDVVVTLEGGTGKAEMEIQ